MLRLSISLNDKKTGLLIETANISMRIRIEIQIPEIFCSASQISYVPGNREEL